jgi:ATP-dependent DNA ligase
MLCSPFEQRLVDKIKFPAITQCKMDGMRFNAIVREGKCEFRSRNGKEIQLLGNLEQEFISLAGDVDCVFDGELLVMRDGAILSRQEGNGILNKANKGTISANDAAMVNATVWDIIPYVYFTDGHCPTPYSTRFTTLQNMNLSGKIHLVESAIVDDIETAKATFEKYLAAGQEGIILKDMNGPWEDKRSKGQIKFKGEMECDLKVVAVEEGSGKYEGQLGALVCVSSDGIVKVNVGSGFNDEQRKSLMPRDLLGKIIAVKYNARIKNNRGDESLFLPIFVEIREDKDVADSSKLIK